MHGTTQKTGKVGTEPIREGGNTGIESKPMQNPRIEDNPHD